MNSDQQPQMPPARVEMQVTNDTVYCAAQYGAGYEKTLRSVHNEIKWAMDRGDVLLEQYDVIDVSPK